MSTDKTYNTLLNKLLEGTITDKELWSLERASLDDPFLADALEGYHNEKTEQQELTGLKQKLNAKTPTKTRILKWRYLPIAASLFLLITASLWLTKQANQPIGPTNKEMVEIQTAPKDKTVSPLEEKPELKDKAIDYTVDKATPTPPINKQPTPAKKPFKQKNKVSQIQTSAPPTESVSPANEAEVAKEELAMTEVEQVNIQESSIEKNLDITDNATTSKKASKAKVGTARQETKSSDPPSKRYKSSPVPKTPNIIQGVVTNEKGLPVPGVLLLDNNNNELAETDADGQFAFPETAGYVIAAFAGYDSTTVALAPQLDIKLQKSTDTFNQPLKRLVDILDDNELIIHYTNKLNSLFSKHWPLCQTGWQNGNASNPSSVSLTLAIDNSGRIEDLHIYRELSPDCQEKIENILEQSEESIFEIERPITFTFRINL